MTDTIRTELRALAFALLLPLPLMGQRARIDTTVRVNLGGTVDLSLLSGKIIVRGWDQPGVRIRAYTTNGILRFNANSNRATLRMERRGKEGTPGEATYNVLVPRGTRLTLQTTSGTITVSGSQGEVSATTVSGGVDVTDGRRQVALESVSGPIRVSQIAGDVRAQNVSGSVRAETVSGRVEAWTVTGDIRLVGLRGVDVHTETVRGDIAYAGPIATGGTYDFESHSGAIRLTVPRTSNVRFRLETVSGAVHPGFPTRTQAAAASRSPGRVQFTVGDGGAEVLARTFSGPIVIKGEAAPAAPIIRRGFAGFF